MKASRQLDLTIPGATKLALILLVCLVCSGSVYSQTSFTRTYHFGGSIEVACCSKGPMSWGFTPVIQDTSLSGNIQINSISVTDTGSISATDPNGVAGTTWEIFVGSSPCGFPVGEVTGVVNLSTYSCNAPTQLVFNTNGVFQAPATGTFSGSYNFTTATFTANDMGAFVSDTNAPANLTQGLFAQILLWGGDVGADLTLSNISITVTGTVTSAAPTDQFVPINFPDAASTFPATINDLGQVVGTYTEPGGTHGFLLSAGVFTTIDVPNATATGATGINNNGQIVGVFNDSKNVSHGFSLSNGTFTTIDDPALPGGILGLFNSDFGLIVGSGLDSNGVTHGFLLNAGKFSSLDFPGANSTQPLDVNFNGSEIVGSYSLPSFPAKTIQGFTYINGVFKSVTFPKSASTAVNGVNNTGELVGTYFLPDETNANVFLLNGSTFTTNDVPGAVSTAAADLNDLGVIIGAFTNDQNVTSAFLETSGPFLYTAGSGGVAVLDATTDLTVTTIPISGAYELAVTPDQSHIYVADAGSNSVSVINTASNAVTATIPVGSFPDGVAITPDGALVYVANNGGNSPNSNTVSVINTGTNTVVSTITVGPAPFLPKVTPDGTHVYVSNQNNTISVIDTSTNTVSSTIQLSAEATGLAFSPNGAFAYVGENTTPGNVAVLAIPSNKVVTTIPLGTGTGAPIKVAITPDGAFVYVTNLGSNNVSVISTATNSAVATIPAGKEPYAVAVSPDGSHVYVGNVDGSTMSVINTATNTVVSTLPVATGVTGIAAAAGPPGTQQVTQALSPNQPNTFNFGTNSFVVQYPAGTSFSGVSMTVTEVEITQGEFGQRVAGTHFAGATCIAYAGAGGNCVDYQVTCSSTATGNPVTCPGEAAPTIAVQTDFTTLQPIVNPGFLTTPIGENEWTNIFTGFSDPIVRGKTKGFSEFVAVDLPVTNSQGEGTLAFVAPLRSTDPRTFSAGVAIPAAFDLTSLANSGKPITNAVANLTIQMVANAAGQAQSTVVLALLNAFKFQSGSGEYLFQINSSGFAAGTYVLTVYGDSFAAQHVQFTIAGKIATTCSIHTSSPLFTKGEHITFTARVQPAANSVVSPTGKVTFMDSGNSLFVLGTASLAADVATIKPALQAPPDRQWIKAVYAGDANFLPCTSQSIAEDFSAQ